MTSHGLDTKRWRGISAGRARTTFPRKALARGTRVEMEHTSDRAVAERIAMDHLTEDPWYYTKLAKMEATANRAGTFSDAPGFQEAVAQYLARLNESSEKRGRTVHVKPGRVYLKVVETDRIGGRQALAFIDKRGFLYKAKSFQSPDTKRIRGSVYQ